MTQAAADDALQHIQEALPYLAHYRGKSIVLKLGGSVGLEPWILEDIAWLFRLGIRPVVVHGGGPMISDWQQRLG